MAARLGFILRIALGAIYGTTAFCSDAATEGAFQRKQFLEKEIERHNALYFKKAQPEISDTEFDRLKVELDSLRQQFPANETSLSSADLNGDDRVAGFSKHAHGSAMLSLDKAYSQSAVEAFAARVAEVLGDESVRFAVEPKYDGLAVSAIYENGQLVRVVTRGDGREGDDVTLNARRFSNIPLRFRQGDGDSVPTFVDARGEVFMSKAEFARVNEEREDAEESEYASPRNLASGALKSVSGGETKERHLNVVFYATGQIEPTTSVPSSQIALCHQFERWGLPTIAPVRASVSRQDIWKAVQDISRQREKLPYPIDGVVIKVDSLQQRERLGANGHAPNWALAYKFIAERRATRLRAITIQVGRTGVLTPVAELEPVRLGGALITRATLHNADEIARRDLRVGDMVELERTGDVIPSVVGPLLSERRPDAVAFTFPSRCPSCDAVVSPRNGEVTRRCTNLDCPAQRQRRLVHFVSARGMGINGLGEATLSALIQSGKVRDPVDLYRLNRDDLIAIPSIGERRGDKLLKSISRSRAVDLRHQLTSLGIPGVGAGVAGRLEDSFQSLREIAAANEQELTAAGGINVDTAREIIAFFGRRSVRELIAELSQNSLQTQ